VKSASAVPDWCFPPDDFPFQASRAPDRAARLDAESSRLA